MNSSLRQVYQHLEPRQLPYRTDLTLAFRDIDVLGHVNNATYFQWFESARVYFFMQLSGDRTLTALPMTLAQTSCEYLKPLTWGDQVSLACGVSRIGKRSFDFVYLVSEHTKGLCVIGASVQVSFDHLTQHSTDLSPQLRAALTAALVPGASP